LRLALAGAHQVSNALTAVRLLEEGTAAGVARVPEVAIRSAVEQVVWPARLELLHHGDIPVLVDGAHNPAGARALAQHVKATYGRSLPFVIGVMRDKAIDRIVAALADAASHFVCVAVPHERAATPAELMAIARAQAPHVPAMVDASPAAGLTRATAFGSPVVVAGSLYLAGEIRAMLA
jgi:dihydrofolate synthase/folylpolyglutamate synthase